MSRDNEPGSGLAPLANKPAAEVMFTKFLINEASLGLTELIPERSLNIYLCQISEVCGLTM